MRHILMLVLLTGVAAAQDKPPPRRDPTLPSEKLRDAMKPSETQKTGPTSPIQKLPVFALRTRITGSDGATSALIETDKKLVRVVKGTTFKIGPLTFEAVEVSRQAVRLDVMPGKQSIVIE